MQINTIINIDTRTGLKELPDNSIDCCVTSPPYFNLRDYGVDGQIGLEDTPEEYINQMLIVFQEVYRVLKPTGTLWVNIGDSYAGSMKGAANYPENAMNYKQDTNRGLLGKSVTIKKYSGYKNKDLIGIPWMLAFALRSQGWYLRQDIIWSKPSCMPESVRDRCTKSHEYIFLLSKSSKYYFDQEAIRMPLKDSSIARIAQNVEEQDESERAHGYKNLKAIKFGGHKYNQFTDKYHRTKSGKVWNPTMAGGGKINNCGRSGYFDGEGKILVKPTANKRSVWEVSTQPFKEAHFAVFPEKLIKDCILAGSPKGGIV